MNDKNNLIEITHKTYDQIALDYSTKIDKFIFDSWIWRFETSLMDKLLSVTKLSNPVVLDVGCGNGKDTDYLRHKGAVVVGIDISRGMLGEARKRIAEGILCQMDMRNLGFYDGVFDEVWANACIYHIPKTELIQVLKEVQRVLKPLGAFSFNFKVGVGEQLEESPRSFQRGARFYAYYTISEMKNYLIQAGFEISGVEEYPQRILDEEIVHIWAHKP